MPLLAAGATLGGALITWRALDLAQGGGAPPAAFLGGLLLAAGLGLSIFAPRLLGEPQRLVADRRDGTLRVRTTTGRGPEVRRTLAECSGVEVISASDAMRAMTGELREQLRGEGSLGHAVLALADWAERQQPAPEARSPTGRYLRLRFTDGAALLLPNEGRLPDAELERLADELRAFLGLPSEP